MKLITLLLSCTLLSAVETEPVQVLSVYDGDTATVAGSIGGVELKVKLRFLYLDTPELWEKYGKADERWRGGLVAAEDEAKKLNAGAWGTNRKWILDKANETTAKK